MFDVLIFLAAIAEGIILIALRARYLKVLNDNPSIVAERSVLKIAYNWIIRKKQTFESAINQ